MYTARLKNILEEKLSKGMQRAALVFISRSMNSFLTLLFSLLAGKLLTVEDHGLFGQSMARIIVIQAITEVGLQYSLVRFLSPALKSGDGNLAAIILRASLRIKFYTFLVVGVFVLVLLLLYRFNTSVVSALFPFPYPDGLAFLWLIFLGGFGMSLVSYLDAVLVSHQKYLRLSLWLPGLGFIRLFFLGIFWIMEKGDIDAMHVVYIYAFAPFFSGIFFFAFFPASFFFKKPSESISPWVKKLIKFNLWIVAASFFSITSDWMEVLLISDSRDTGLYNAARIPMQGFLILLTTMQSILLPRFSGLTTRDEFRSIFLRLYRYIIPATFLLLPGLVVFHYFIPAWYGQEYNASLSVLYILYPSFLLRVFFAPLGTALFALDQPRIIAVEAGLRMSAGLALNLILIPEYGITGAAWSNFFSQFAGWIFLIYCYFLYFKTDKFPLNRHMEGNKGS